MRFLPAIITITMMTIGATNLHLQTLSLLYPHMALICIFFWGIYWPRVIPIWFVFLLGFYDDVLTGQHPGIQSSLLIISWFILVSYRKILAKQPFPNIWLLFLIFISLYEAVAWLLYSAFKGSLYFDEAFAIYIAVNALVYPFLHQLFTKLHMRLIKNYKVKE